MLNIFMDNRRKGAEPLELGPGQSGDLERDKIRITATVCGILRINTFCLA